MISYPGIRIPSRPADLPEDLEASALAQFVREVLGDLALTADSPTPEQLVNSLLWQYRDRREELYAWTTLLVTWEWLKWWMEKWEQDVLREYHLTPR